jgi:hypothetical protein
MIVRNEAPTLRATLDSADAAMAPPFVVVHDTGSTDDTVAVVQRWAAERPVRGQVIVASRPFDDFSSARNAVLAHAFGVRAPGQRAPVCMLDAGVLVSGTWAPEDAPAGRVGAWTARCALGTVVYPRAQVFTPGWHYVGRVHEVAIPGPRAHTVQAASGLTFTYALRDEAREKRWTRDLSLLEDDTTPRGMFYYAQTLDCLGRRTQAYAAYLARIHCPREGGGFWQERVVSWMRMIPLAPTLEGARVACSMALRADPTRGDAWLVLCARLEDEQAWGELYAAATRALMCVPRADALFARTDREWLANVYAGEGAANRGQYALAREHRLRALALGERSMPAELRSELRIAVAAYAPGCDKSTPVHTNVVDAVPEA